MYHLSHTLVRWETRLFFLSLSMMRTIPKTPLFSPFSTMCSVRSTCLRSTAPTSGVCRASKIHATVVTRSALVSTHEPTSATTIIVAIKSCAKCSLNYVLHLQECILLYHVTHAFFIFLFYSSAPLAVHHCGVKHYQCMLHGHLLPTLPP